MAAIPTAPLPRGTTPFRLSPWALGIQQLARFRCLASPPATSTPLLALDRLILTSRIQIRPLALQRFCLTPPAHTTQLSEQPRLNLMTPVTTTRQLEHSRSLAISPALATPPWDITRSSQTTETPRSERDPITVQLEPLPSRTIPLATTTASSARLHSKTILPAKPTRPLAIVCFEATPPPVSIQRLVFRHSSTTALV